MNATELRVVDRGELDHEDAVREAAPEPSADRERETCLADARRSGEGDQPGLVSHEPADRGELGGPPDQRQPGGSDGHDQLAGTNPRGRSQGGIVGQDAGVEVVEQRSGLEAELVDENLAGAAIHLERVGLTPTAIKRHHQLTGEPLARRTRGKQCLQLRDHGGMPAESQIGLDARLDGGQPQLLQTPDLGLGEFPVGDVGQGRPAP